MYWLISSRGEVHLWRSSFQIPVMPPGSWRPILHKWDSGPLEGVWGGGNTESSMSLWTWCVQVCTTSWWIWEVILWEEEPEWLSEAGDNNLFTGSQTLLGFNATGKRSSVDKRAPEAVFEDSDYLHPWSCFLCAFPFHFCTDLTIGGLGGGKGTQCLLLAQDLRFQHISVSQLLREESERPESKFRDFIHESFKHAITISPWLTTVILRKEMDKAMAEGKNKVLIDEYLRSVKQAEMFKEQVDAILFKSLK